MSISAAQIREARRLIGWSSSWLSRKSTVEFAVVLKAQVEAEINAIDPVAIQTIERAFTKAGVEFTGDSAFLRKSATGPRFRKAEE